MKFKMTEKGFVMDHVHGKLYVSGESQYGYRPFQLLVSSLVGCSGVVLQKVLTKMRIPFKDIEIEANVERNEKEANKIEKVHLHFVITGSNLNEKKVERGLMLARKNCSMIQSVKESIEITESFKLINDSN